MQGCSVWSWFLDTADKHKFVLYSEKNNTDIYLFQHLHYAFVFSKPRPGSRSVGQSILLNQLLFSPCWSLLKDGLCIARFQDSLFGRSHIFDIYGSQFLLQLTSYQVVFDEPAAAASKSSDSSLGLPETSVIKSQLKAQHLFVESRAGQECISRFIKVTV